MAVSELRRDRTMSIVITFAVSARVLAVIAAARMLLIGLPAYLLGWVLICMSIWWEFGVFISPERLESTFYCDSCNKLIKQISVIVSMCWRTRGSEWLYKEGWWSRRELAGAALKGRLRWSGDHAQTCCRNCRLQLQPAAGSLCTALIPI